MSVRNPNSTARPSLLLPKEAKFPNQDNLKKTVWLSDYHIFPTLYCAKKPRKALDPVMETISVIIADTVARFAHSCFIVRLVVRSASKQRRFPRRKHYNVKTKTK